MCFVFHKVLLRLLGHKIGNVCLKVAGRGGGGKWGGVGGH